MGKLARARNYEQERNNGQLELIEGLRLVGREREGESFDILQLAQIFAFCSLPYRPTEERQITHIARMGNGDMVEVTFTAMRPGVSIAFGNDRYLLYWLIDKAIREGTAFISWESASAYLRSMNMNETSGKNRQILQERFRRISSTAITVVRKTMQDEKQAIIPIVRQMYLPNGLDGKKREPGQELVERRKASDPGYGVQFDDAFVKDFMSYRVPVLRSLVVATQERPQMQDCMFFLIWRSYSAAKKSFIPWDALRNQFWQADSNRSRIKQRFEEAITLIRTIWPELQARATSAGLEIGPPRNEVQFVPQLRKPQHLEAAKAEAAKAEAEAAEAKRKAKLDKQLRMLIPGMRIVD